MESSTEDDVNNNVTNKNKKKGAKQLKVEKEKEGKNVVKYI